MRARFVDLFVARRSLPLFLFLAVVVCLCGWQVWLTYRVIEQDRTLAAQRGRERVEQAADLAVSQLNGHLADWDLLLRETECLPLGKAAASRLPVGARLVCITQSGVQSEPGGAVLFVSNAPAPPDMPGVFERASELEFRVRDYVGALRVLAEIGNEAGLEKEWDRGLTRRGTVTGGVLGGDGLHVGGEVLKTQGEQRPCGTGRGMGPRPYGCGSVSGVVPVCSGPPDPGCDGTRGEVLLRVGRLRRKLYQSELAGEAYRRLSHETGVSPAGVPYALLALGALGDGAGLRTALVAGRWPLRRETFEYYWSEADRLTGRREPPPAEAFRLSVWAEQLFERWKGGGGAGREMDERGAVRLWHANSSRVMAVVTPPEWLLATLTPPASSDIVVRRVGAAGGGADRGHAVRSLADVQLNGKVEFIAGTAPVGERGYRLQIAGLAVMFGLMLVGAYASYRGVRRELQAAALQADFVAAVSHEFRSPLTTLRSVAELLVNDRITDASRRQHSYTLLERETGRLQRLVEDLLDFGRMESGRRHYRLEAQDAFALVRSAVAEFREEAMSAGFAIELDLPTSEAMTQVDAEALRRAVRNLLENAVKYSPECRTVWVKGTIGERHASIAVEDKGLGIPAAEQRDIFQNFVRGAEAKRAGIKGTGIGLAMVRHIMDACGGQVQLDSTPGAGSVFTLRLPLWRGGETQA